MPKTVEEAKKKGKEHRLDHLAATASLLPGDVFGTVIGPLQVTDPPFTPVHLPVATVATDIGKQHQDKTRGLCEVDKEASVGARVSFLHVAKWNAFTSGYMRKS